MPSNLFNVLFAAAIFAGAAVLFVVAASIGIVLSIGFPAFLYIARSRRVLRR